MSIKQAQQLIQDVQEKLYNSETRIGTFAGIKNLSVSDLDDAIMYAEHYINNGCTGFHGLIDPVNGVKELLGKYNLCQK